MLLILVEIALVAAAIVILAFFVLDGILVLSSKSLGSPFVPTRRKFFDQIGGALDLKPGSVLYELGSGDGRFLIYCASRMPEVSFVGIDRNPLLVLYANFRKLFAGNPKNVSFILGNFFKADLSEASHIYVYLLPDVMNMLLTKLEHVSKRCRIVSLAFPFRNKKPAEIIQLSRKSSFHNQNLLYVYEL